MAFTVAHETRCSTQIAQQIAQRREGRRRNVRHGGALCCTCLENPPRKGGRDCLCCHKAAQKDYRLRKKQAAKEARKADAAERKATVAAKFTERAQNHDEHG